MQQSGVQTMTVTSVIIQTMFVYGSAFFEGLRTRFSRPATATSTPTSTSTPSTAVPTGVPFKNSTDPCAINLPDTLSFQEPLANGLKPSDIVIYSGGDSYERRTTGFGNITSTYLRKFADHHGYNLVFCDELDYDKSLTVNGVKYGAQWHRIFAFSGVMKRFPEAKYLVWLDDDILAPYPETDMLNHYINMLESSHRTFILIGDDIETQVLNSGMYFAKISPFVQWVMAELIQIGLENENFYTSHHHFEQTCLRELRKRHTFDEQVKIIKHREGVYNFNTFVNIDQIKAQPTDAFIHFINMPHPRRLELMNEYLGVIRQWRGMVPANCTYPLSL